MRKTNQIYYILSIMYFLFAFYFIGKGSIIVDTIIMFLSFVSIIIKSLKYNIVINKVSIYIFLFISYFSVTVLWGQNIYYSIYMYIPFLSATIFALSLALNYSLNERFNIIYKSLLYTMILSLICIIFIPSIGLSSSYGNYWRGVFDFKNKFGSFLVFMVTFSLIKIFIRKEQILMNTIVCIIAIICSIFSKSSGSISLIIVVTCFIAYLLIKRNVINRNLKVLLTILLIAFAIITIMIVPYFIVNIFDKDLTFTGRTLIWQTVIYYCYDNIIFGYGFSHFRIPNSSIQLQVSNILNQQLFSTHNGFLDILLSSGIVGLALFLSVLISILKSFKQYKGIEKESLKVIFLSLILINMIETRFFTNGSMFYWILLLLFFCNLKVVDKFRRS